MPDAVAAKTSTGPFFVRSKAFAPGCCAPMAPVESAMAASRNTMRKRENFTLQPSSNLSAGMPVSMKSSPHVVNFTMEMGGSQAVMVTRAAKSRVLRMVGTFLSWAAR